MPTYTNPTTSAPYCPCAEYSLSGLSAHDRQVPKFYDKVGT